MTDATKDKYYICSSNAVFIPDRTGIYSNPYIIWTYYDESNQSYIDNQRYTSGGSNDYTYLGNKGRVLEQLYGTVTSEVIGFGKSNTSAIMAIERSVKVGGVTSIGYAYIQGPHPIYRGGSTYCETIWYICDHFNKGTYTRKSNTTGCDDWYIPSDFEAWALRSFYGDSGFYSFTKGSSSATYTRVWTSSAGYGLLGTAYAVSGDPDDYFDNPIACDGSGNLNFSQVGLVLIRSF